MTGGPAGVRSPASGATTRRSIAAFSSPPSADQTSEADGPCGSRPRRFQLHGQAEFGEASGVHPGGQYVGADEGAQHLGEQAVFVLRAVGPGGDQIGQLEPARRGPPAGDHALLVVRLGRAGAPSARVLADAVQEDADGRGVAAGGPVLRRGVEDQVDAAVLQSGLGQQQPQPLVDFVDHRRITSSGGVMVPSTTRKSVFTGLKPGPFAVIVRGPVRSLARMRSWAMNEPSPSGRVGAAAPVIPGFQLRG